MRWPLISGRNLRRITPLLRALPLLASLRIQLRAPASPHQPVSGADLHMLSRCSSCTQHSNRLSKGLGLRLGPSLELFHFGFICTSTMLLFCAVSFHMPLKCIRAVGTPLMCCVHEQHMVLEGGASRIMEQIANGFEVIHRLNTPYGLQHPIVKTDVAKQPARVTSI